MVSASIDLLHEQVCLFKRWALSVPIPRYDEWEDNYAEWPALWSAAISVLKSVPPAMWTCECVADLVYAIARDNWHERITDELPGNSDAALALAHHAEKSQGAQAKWQLAAHLGTLSARKKEAEPILLRLVSDEDEYVRRRTLSALGELKSEHAEALAEKAWRTGHEYQRIAALFALKEVNSSRLGDYIRLGIEDGRAPVVQAAREVGDRI